MLTLRRTIAVPSSGTRDTDSRVRATRLLSFALVRASALAVTACSREAPSPPMSVSAPPPVASPSMTPAGRDPAHDFVAQQLALRITAFGGRFVPAGAPLRGSLATGGTASHDLDTLGGHCYRVVAVGGVDVNDLDLALYGADGSEVDADTQGDSYPTLGATRPLCPPSGGHYRIEVRMHGGQGEYGLQVFRTP